MNAFDDLLPPRVTPPPLPHRGGPATVVRAARVRRRRQATNAARAGTALTMAVAGLLVLHGPAATHGIKEGPPATQPPSTPGTANVHRLRLPGTHGQHSPGTQPASTAPSSNPAFVPSGTPAPAPVTFPPSPVTTTPAVRFARIDKTIVDDRPTESCVSHTSNNHPGIVLCLRALPVPTLRYGTGTDLAYEFCAQAGNVTIRFPTVQEIHMNVGLNTDPDINAGMWQSHQPTAPAPHDLAIPRGKCARYTAHWDGRDNAGKFLPRGGYKMAGIPVAPWENTAPGPFPGSTFTIE